MDEHQVAKELGALRHPIRIRVLRICLRSDKALSPSDLSTLIVAPLGVVSYHIRQLAAAGLLKLTTTKQRRGAVEHYYKITGRGQKLLEAVEFLSR